jgi:hypothetical protein
MNKYQLDWQEFTKGFNETLTKNAAKPLGVFGKIKGWFTRKPSTPHAPTPTPTPPPATGGSNLKDMAKIFAAQSAFDLAMNKATGMFGGGHPGGGLGGVMPEGFLPNAKPANPYQVPHIPHTIKLDVTPPRDMLSTYEAPMSLNTTPTEMSAPLYSKAELNKAGGISELLVKNLQNKATDKVIGQFINAPKEKEVTPEEIEIVTQHPEMREVLKDEKNRAYLEKLINS